MSNLPHTTFAQNLWRQVVRGRETSEYAVTTFVSCVGERDIEQQLATMPEEMLIELERYLATLPIGTPEWDDYFLLFGTDQIPYREEAILSNRRNAAKIHDLLQRRRNDPPRA